MADQSTHTGSSASDRLCFSPASMESNRLLEIVSSTGIGFEQHSISENRGLFRSAASEGFLPQGNESLCRGAGHLVTPLQPRLRAWGGGVLLVTVPAQAQHFRSNLLDHARGGQASRPVAPSNLGGGGWGGWMQSLVTQRLMGVTRLSLPSESSTLNPLQKDRHRWEARGGAGKGRNWIRSALKQGR